MSVVVGRWQIKILEQFYMEASQTRDYGVAKSADTSRGSPSSSLGKPSLARDDRAEFYWPTTGQ
jgi:hypothetical protein